MMESSFDTLISVEHKQIACVYDNKPINFVFFPGLSSLSRAKVKIKVCYCPTLLF